MHPPHLAITSVAGVRLRGPVALAIAILASLVPLTACAQQAATPAASATIAPLTLSQATGIALAVSPSVQAAEENLAQAQARLRQAQAGRRFQLSFNSTASLSNGDVYQPPPTSETFGALQNTFTVPLPVGPKLSDLERQAQSQYDAAAAQAAAARTDAAAGVQDSYFDLLKQQALLAIAQQNVTQAQTELDAAKKRFADGAGTQVDILQAQVPLVTAQAAVLQANNNVLSASQALNNQLQRDLDSPASIADIDIVSPVTITLDQARAQAVAISPDVRAAQDNVDSARAALAAARLSREPDLALQASDARSKDVTGFSRLDTVQISLTMPLSDGGLAREQVAEAQAALDFAQTALLQARQSAELAAGEAYLTAQGALAQVGPTQTAADIAQTTLEKTQEGYLAGLNPIYDVLNAQVALNQAKIAHAQALYDAASAVAALNRSLGKVMP